jgi:hypothetical protein
VRDERSELRFAAQDVGIAFSQIDWVADVPGIRAREAQIEGHRWAIVEYAIGARRYGWCLDGHAGFVLSGTVEYEFEDGGAPLIVGEGDAFALSTGRAHRGRNRAREPTRLFVIDDPAG